VNSQGPEQFDFRKEIHVQTAVFQVADVMFKSVNKKMGGRGEFEVIGLYLV